MARRARPAAPLRAASGGILPYLTTANVARDLDLLRAAVGDAKLNYFGLSYGGLIGETYATLFPGRTGALVLDSPVDGDVWLNRPFEALREQQASFENSLDRFLHWCSRARGGVRARSRGPRGRLRRAGGAAQRRARPRSDDPAQPPVNGDEMLGVAGDAMYSRYIWAPLAAPCRRRGRATGAASARWPAAAKTLGRLLRLHGQRGRYRGGVDRFMREQEHDYALADHFFLIRNSAWVGLTLWPFEPRGVYRGPFRHAPGAQTGAGHRRHPRSRHALQGGAARYRRPRQRAAADVPLRRARRADRPQPVHRRLVPGLHRGGRAAARGRELPRSRCPSRRRSARRRGGSPRLEAGDPPVRCR